jgi:hypothetical protein
VPRQQLLCHKLPLRFLSTFCFKSAVLRGAALTKVTVNLAHLAKVLNSFVPGNWLHDGPELKTKGLSFGFLIEKALAGPILLE